MEADVQESGRNASSNGVKGVHLCVLVHGLWGNPSHMAYIASALRERYGEDELVVLAVQRNAGSFTYDGIELGAERVVKEIEETIEELGRDGNQVKKLSMVGYSLGGLVARYVCGLLHSCGWFEKIRPATFTTFASPHLGVRAPLTGYANQLRNEVGARTLCMSGRQLFMIDKFRDTGRPLLSVLADPNSIFIHALKRFENRSLYANIVNDRSAPFYTTAFSRIDPYAQMDNIDLNYLREYEHVVLNPDAPVSLRKEQEVSTFYSRLVAGGRTYAKSLPVYVALAVLFPAAFVVYLANSSIQTVRSRRRIRLHEDGHERLGFGVYRIPLFIQGVHRAVENAYENVNAAPSEEYLPTQSEELAKDEMRPQKCESPFASSDENTSSLSSLTKAEDNHMASQGLDEFPTLALTSAQFEIMRVLDDCGFQKFPVHITKSAHSHAAIVVRISRPSFFDGKVVINHWLNEVFKI